MTAAAGATFATAHRMVDRVHGDAAVVRTKPEPTRAARFAHRDVLMIGVRNLANRGPAIEVHAANLAARKPNLAPRAFFRHQLRGHTGRAAKLTALALLQLEVVDRRAERDGPQRKAVARLDVRVTARDDGIAHLDAVWSEDVPLLTVDICKSAMRAVRLGSYSTAAILAGTPIFSRRKSMMR